MRLRHVSIHNRAIGFVLLCYVFSMPFTSAFALTPTINFSLLIALGLFLMMSYGIVTQLKIPQGFADADITIMVLMVIAVLFDFFVNGWGNGKSFNHTIAYLSTFVFFYSTIKYSLFSAVDPENFFYRLLKTLTIITAFCSAYACFEFIAYNFFSWDINEWIPRPSDDEKMYDASVLEMFYRARGFAPESGHFTFMLEMFSPPAIYYMFFSKQCHWKSLMKVLITVSIVLGFIFATSTASFIILPLSVLMASLPNYKKMIRYLQKRLKRVALLLVIVIGSVVASENYLPVSGLVLLSISDKIESGSFDDRQERIHFFFEQFPKLPVVNQMIGVGPAAYQLLGYDETKSILSLYYSITFELGLIGFILLTAFLLYLLKSVISIRSTAGFFFSVSLFCGIMHYYFIANYWYPWFWFMAALILFYHRRVYVKQDPQ